MTCAARSTRLGWLTFFRIAIVLTVSTTVSTAVSAQSTPDTSRAAFDLYAAEHAEQIAKVLGLSGALADARRMHASTSCGSPATSEELVMRQAILERAMVASFQVDGVLAEISNEHAHLFELSALLQARRDHAVNLANVANLITGTGLGIAVNALQFSNSTANIGNGIGVASGAASTVLSIAGLRLQRGPQSSVGRMPNMLAPLFARPAVLNADYPPAVIAYLHSVPPGENNNSGTRLDQLMAEWRRAGRLGAPGSVNTEQQITRLTSGLGDNTKLSIDDLSNRMAMLSDVAGQVALMKRDLADLLLSMAPEKSCPDP